MYVRWGEVSMVPVCVLDERGVCVTSMGVR